MVDALVPLARTASLFDGPRVDTPLYRFPVFGLLAIAIAAVATGVAREALDHFIVEAGRAVPQASTKPLASKPTVQEAVARAEARLQSARAWLLAMWTRPGWPRSNPVRCRLPTGATCGWPPPTRCKAQPRWSAASTRWPAAARCLRRHRFSAHCATCR